MTGLFCDRIVEQRMSSVIVAVRCTLLYIGARCFDRKLCKTLAFALLGAYLLTPKLIEWKEQVLRDLGEASSCQRQIPETD